MIGKLQTIILFYLVIKVTATTDDSECDTDSPEFSHFTGYPEIKTIKNTDGVTGVRITWNTDQLLYAPECADAFEAKKWSKLSSNASIHIFCRTYPTLILR